jgi:hypothetical protein
MEDIHPLDKMASAMEVQAGDPSECPEAWIESLFPSDKWEIDFSGWDAGGESITSTLKTEHQPRINLKPTDVYIAVYVSADYYFGEEEYTSVCVMFDFVQDEDTISPDHEFDSLEYEGHLNEMEVVTCSKILIEKFKNQLKKGI